MKKSVVLLLLLEINLSFGQKTDEEIVKEVVFNYIENFFVNDYDQMIKSLHPKYTKRGLHPNRTLSSNFTFEKLNKILSSKKALPKSDQRNEIQDVYIYRDVATVQLWTGLPNLKWVEFIHLVRKNNQWKIINVFWEYIKKE